MSHPIVVQYSAIAHGVAYFLSSLCTLHLPRKQPDVFYTFSNATSKSEFSRVSYLNPNAGGYIQFSCRRQYQA